MDRRTFLGAVGGGLAMAHGVGCGGAIRSDLRDPLGPAPALAYLDDPLRVVLEHAALAPSGHNAQPWNVELVSSRRMFVGTVRERWLPAVDATNRETMLSLGAFVENLSLAAGASALEAHVDVVADDAKAPRVLDVELRPGPRVDYPLQRITSRKTLRAPYATTRLDARALSAITGAAGSLVRYLPRGEPDCAFLDEVTLAAVRQQSYRDDAQRELVTWMRWSNDEVLEKRDGLSLAAVGITGLTGWAARTFLGKESLMSESQREKAVDIAREQVPGSAGWLVLSTEDASVRSLVDCGRRCERMLLAMRELGVGVHPMSQALEEVPHRDRVAARFGAAPQFLLRVGYVSDFGDPVSLRRPLASFVKLASG